MSRDNKKIAIACFRYGFEVSPVLKNLCSYLFDNGFGISTVYLDKLYRAKSIKPRGAKLISLKDHHPLRFRYYKYILKLSGILSFQKFIEKKLDQHKLIFAVEYASLQCLYTAGIDLSRVVYLSFEGVDEIKRLGNPDKAWEILDACGMRIIQNKERQSDLEEYLEKKLDFEFLPVSQRPTELDKRTHSGELKIIYSGYFCEWSGLLEFTDAYINSGSNQFSTLLLQGHAMGTEDYKDQLTEKIKDVHNTTIDGGFYDDDSHQKLLAQFDVGVAFYENVSNSTNFENLITSSGKIASYLWNGLAILTNIKSEQTLNPPFVYIENYNADDIRKALIDIQENKQDYRNSALSLANKTYNFDDHMNIITKRLQENFSL